MQELGEPFDDWRANPGPETLRRLVVSVQDRVYTLCFHILTHRQDAEDASQEVFLEVLKGIREISDADHFRRWTIRVAVHTALDAKRIRSHRATRERKKALMEGEERRLLPAGLADAVYEAIGRLDDDSRALIVEHYFEETTLESLGRRYACSPVAIWKRIVAGKERLKLALGNLGLGAMIPGLDSLFGSIHKVPCPDPIVQSVLLAKAAASVSRLSWVKSIPSMGGALMSSKATATLVLVAILAFSAGIAGGLVIKSRRDPSASDRERESLVKRLAARTAEAQAAREEAARRQAQVREPHGVSSGRGASAGSPDSRRPETDSEKKATSAEQEVEMADVFVAALRGGTLTFAIAEPSEGEEIEQALQEKSPLTETQKESIHALFSVWKSEDEGKAAPDASTLWRREQELRALLSPAQADALSAFMAEKILAEWRDLPATMAETAGLAPDQQALLGERVGDLSVPPAFLRRETYGLTSADLRSEALRRAGDLLTPAQREKIQSPTAGMTLRVTTAIEKDR